ncbi:hypothetical protein ACFLZ2_00385 [Candidatus Margulisiibacteriota bacterium]
MVEEPKNNELLRKNVENFLRSYGTLSADGRVAFLVSLDKSIKGKNEREKRMYIALLKAARDGKDIDQAIESMDKASKEGE